MNEPVQPVEVSITDDQRAALVSQVQALARLRGVAASDVLSPALTVGELRDQLAAAEDILAPADPTSYQAAMTVLGYVGAVLGALTPASTFVGSVAGAATALKAL